MIFRCLPNSFVIFLLMTER